MRGTRSLIFGIGTDLVRISRMEDNLLRYGDKFAARILAENELHEFHNAPRKAHFLAKRFAAKEAAAKAMGTGFAAGLNLRHIGVGHNEQGKPLLEFYGKGDELCREKGIGASFLSITDEGDYALAFVTLLVAPTKQNP